jgi:hypothetical protein
MKIVLLFVVTLGLNVSVASADCGGVCRPGIATPEYARKACDMVNSFPADIRENTCVNSNGCQWTQGQEVDVCAPGPATPDYARKSCEMVNSFPLDIRAQTCVNSNGCVMMTTCQ